MVNKAKAKGTAHETAFVQYLRANGWRARRKALAGSLDEGDVEIEGLPAVFELKATAAIQVGPFIDQANVEARNSGVPIGIAVVKRRGTTDVGRYHALLDVATLMILIDAYAKSIDDGR